MFLALTHPQRSFHWPSLTDAPAQGNSVYAKIVSPRLQALRLALVGYQVGAAAIAGVFPTGNPAAVLGEISKIVINTINLMFGARHGAHVSDKLLNIVQPLRAHRDSSATIPMVALMRCGIAPRLHGNPGSVSGIGGHSVGAHNAPTAAGTKSGRQADAADLLDVSAFAAAIPKENPFLADSRSDGEMTKSNNGPIGKDLAREICHGRSGLASFHSLHREDHCVKSTNTARG